MPLRALLNDQDFFSEELTIENRKNIFDCPNCKKSYCVNHKNNHKYSYADLSFFKKNMLRQMEFIRYYVKNMYTSFTLYAFCIWEIYRDIYIYNRVYKSEQSAQSVHFNLFQGGYS